MKKWFLKVPFIFDKSGECIVFAKPPFKIRNGEKHVADFIKSLKKGITEQELNLYLQKPSCKFCFQSLQSRQLVVCQNVIENQHPVYQRTLSYLHSITSDSHLAWKEIQSAKIAILGCGGTGSLVAENLIAMGVQHLSLIDGDEVEPSNLNRQILFTQEDCGKPKVDCLRNHLLERVPEVSIYSHRTWIEDKSSLEKVLEEDISFLVVCYDQPPILSQLWSLEIAMRRQIPCMMGGVGNHWGSWGPLLAIYEHQENYYQYLSSLNEIYMSDSESTVSGSLCATNQMIAAGMSLDIFHFLCKDVVVHSFGKKVCLNFNNLQFNYLDFTHEKRDANSLFTST